MEREIDMMQSSEYLCEYAITLHHQVSVSQSSLFLFDHLCYLALLTSPQTKR